jgi:hypothetical protein
VDSVTIEAYRGELIGSIYDVKLDSISKEKESGYLY